jgi:hypothetical protein
MILALIFKIRKQNKPFDMDNNQQITKGEIMNYVRKKWGI